jgi:hypothetical protein
MISVWGTIFGILALDVPFGENSMETDGKIKGSVYFMCFLCSGGRCSSYLGFAGDATLYAML